MTPSHDDLIQILVGLNASLNFNRRVSNTSLILLIRSLVILGSLFAAAEVSKKCKEEGIYWNRFLDITLPNAGVSVNSSVSH